MVDENKVYFTDRSLQMKSGKFVIKAFDTGVEENTLAKDQVYKFENTSDGHFIFGVNRNNQTSVADWWTKDKKVQAGENTFNKYPDKLNFAIEGQLTIGYEDLPSGDRGELVFEQAYLAQGHHDTTNNWWFAIRGAENVGEDTIEATSTNGKKAKFRRGKGSNPNEVKVYV